MNPKSPSDLSGALSALAKAKEYCLDLETTGLNPRTDRIIGVALAVGDRQWYLSFTGSEGLPFLKTMKQLRGYFLDGEKTVVLHNAKFDVQMLLAAGYRLDNRIACTMIAAYLVDENRSGTGRLALKGKGGLVDELFDVELETYKESSLGGNLFGKPEAEYAKDDVKWAFKVWKKLKPQLKREGMEKYFWDLAMPMVRILADMELAGMMVDTPYLWSLSKRYRAELTELDEVIQDLAGVKFNVGSTEQLSRILFNRLGFMPMSFMKPGANGFYSTSVDVLSRYAAEGKEIAQKVLDWRSIGKRLSTYVTPFIKRSTDNTAGRIYAKLNQTGTKTGRLSSNDPNLQNVPRLQNALRKAFCAPPGKVLIVIDYSQLELRIMAHQSQDPTMLEVYRAGGDIHQMTQDAIGCDERVVAKAVNFGLIYLMQPPTFQKQLWKQARIHKSLDECEHWSWAFFQQYPGLTRYHNHIKMLLNRQGYVKTLCGRKRRLKEAMARGFDSAWRVAINVTIQGSAADIINIAMRNIARELEVRKYKDSRWGEVKMLMQVHDELIFEAPESIAEEVKEMVVAQMIAAASLRVPLGAEGGIGPTWEEAK